MVFCDKGRGGIHMLVGRVREKGGGWMKEGYDVLAAVGKRERRFCFDCFDGYSG